MAIHVAYIQMIPVNALGGVVDKNNCTIGQRAGASEEPRVLYDAVYAPNAADNPRIEVYLAAEEAAGFVNIHLVSATMIVTSN